jgi:hypothetical protein
LKGSIMPIASKSTYTEKSKRRMPRIDDVFEHRTSAKVAPARDAWLDGGRFTNAIRKVAGGRPRQQAGW